MATLKFNKVHKNGWISYKQTGTPGAVFIDKRMLSAEAQAAPAETIEVEITGLVAPGADASAKDAEKEAKKAAKEAEKAAKAQAAQEKAAAKLVKLQEAATKAAERAAALAAKANPAAAEAVQ